MEFGGVGISCLGIFDLFILMDLAAIILFSGTILPQMRRVSTGLLLLQLLLRTVFILLHILQSSP
jgi:hypothetical protein